VDLRRKVEELRDQGLLHEEIAREVGISRSRVTQILSSRDVTLKGLRGIKQPKPKPKAKPKITLQQIMETMFGAGATGLHDILLQFVDMKVYRDFLRLYVNKKQYNPTTGDIVLRRVPLDGNRSFTVNMHRKGTIQVRIACTGFGNEIKTFKEFDNIVKAIKVFLATNVPDEEIRSSFHVARYTPEGVEIETPWFNIGANWAEAKEYWRVYFTEGRIKVEEIPTETMLLSDLRENFQAFGEVKEGITLLAQQVNELMDFKEALGEYNEQIRKHLEYVEEGKETLKEIRDGIKRLTELVKLQKSLLEKKSTFSWL